MNQYRDETHADLNWVMASALGPTPSLDYDEVVGTLNVHRTTKRDTVRSMLLTAASIAMVLVVAGAFPINHTSSVGYSVSGIFSQDYSPNLTIDAVHDSMEEFGASHAHFSTIRDLHTNEPVALSAQLLLPKALGHEAVDVRLDLERNARLKNVQIAMINSEIRSSLGLAVLPRSFRNRNWIQKIPFVFSDTLNSEQEVLSKHLDDLRLSGIRSTILSDQEGAQSYRLVIPGLEVLSDSVAHSLAELSQASIENGSGPISLGSIIHILVSSDPSLQASFFRQFERRKSRLFAGLPGLCGGGARYGGEGQRAKYVTMIFLPGTDVPRAEDLAETLSSIQGVERSWVTELLVN